MTLSIVVVFATDNGHDDLAAALLRRAIPRCTTRNATVGINFRSRERCSAHGTGTAAAACPIATVTEPMAAPPSRESTGMPVPGLAS